MKTVLIASSLAAMIAMGSAPAFADDDDDCKTPMAEWQPREKLREKLEADGWKVTRIKTDDGCYEVDAIDREGKSVEALFEPKSLNLIGLDHDDD
jgi:hypothetical protein